MNQRMSLYFIALIPHRDIREKVLELKEEMKERFKAGHALKSPAHITLQKPFERFPEEDTGLKEVLRLFASSQHSFTVDFNGFGSFAPRVIYIKITNPEPVLLLHSRLNRVLLAELHFTRGEIMKDVQPHITIATRDLTPAAFNEAWPEIKDRQFSASFNVHSIFLLKHNGRNWDILEEFPFVNDK
jgi:2'-5' RNA ligase